jgi:hypothetical protein
MDSLKTRRSKLGHCHSRPQWTLAREQRWRLAMSLAAVGQRLQAASMGFPRMGSLEPHHLIPSRHRRCSRWTSRSFLVKMA